MISNLDFPDTIPNEPIQFKWATMVPGRSTAPAFKIHRSIGAAKNAIINIIGMYSRASEGTSVRTAVYELIDNIWRKKWDIPKGTKREDLPWQKKSTPQQREEQQREEARRQMVQEARDKFSALPPEHQVEVIHLLELAKENVDKKEHEKHLIKDDYRIGSNKWTFNKWGWDG